ncbi:MAG: sigma-54-dependent Fis family transcriptional regulator [Verrucomicrobia bacterium]|nr:sigma-54-dependent Fis family transcriptional regulator [Verrucomicrobiota bacterium]
MRIEKIILVEDEEFLRKNLAHYLRGRRIDVAAVETIEEAQNYLARDNFDLMFLDLRLPDGDGTEFLKELNLRPSKPLIIIMSGFGSVESAVECMRCGAFDYLIKPFSNDQIEVALKKAEKFTQILKVNQYFSLHEDQETQRELLGKSRTVDRLRQLIRKIAQTQATVLIQGESGTGKELVARALHRLSPRSGAPFIKVNCAALPENLVESELFGHEKGAFTGALNKREGRFELAHGGTILLDEISEISLAMQAKLLRVLQEREFERVGGSRTIKIDVRVIATTNRKLEESVERNEFRQDLFFRLNVVPIHVAPLRERAEDILYLAENFAQRFVRKHGVAVRGLSADAERALLAHKWPGNIRELQNVVERAVILCEPDQPIEPDHLSLEPAATRVSNLQAANATTAGPSPNRPFVTLYQLEKQHILAALELCQQNRTQAAKLLDINIRTLRNKLNEYKSPLGEDASLASEELPAAESAQDFQPEREIFVRKSA